MKVGKTGGGVGTNQYAVKGRAKVLPTGTIDTPPVSMALVSGTDRRRCGEVWGTKCQAWVTPPEYTHGKHPTSGTRERYVDRADADPRVLEELSADKDTLVRSGVARNPNTRPEVLDTLAQDESVWVRSRVARNPYTSPEALGMLAHDERVWVRAEVAENPKTSPEVLRCLAEDSEYTTRVAVARNLRTSPEVLDDLVEDSEHTVRIAVARNLRTRPTTLRGMVRDPNIKVVEAALCNPNLPDAIKAIYILGR